jgi:outer membrane lipoprotein-sorting protein
MKKTLAVFGLIISGVMLFIGNGYSLNLDEILKKHMDALGGKENLLGIKTQYNEAKMKVGGLEGAVKTWWSEPNLMRDDADFSIFKQSMVCDGEKCWMKDQNGKVRELVGYEKEKIDQELYFETYAYLFPERGKGSVKLLGEEDHDYVVEITPPGGEPRKLFLNDSTFLIDKYKEPMDEETLTVYLSDYRSVDGVVMPFSAHQTTGKPQYDMYIETEQVLVNPALGDTLFLKPKEEGKDYRFTNSTTSTRIPFELVSNHIYLKVKVNNSPPLSFILDTGAGANCLDLTKARELGIQTVGKVEAKGVGGSADASFLQVDSIGVGDLVLVDQKLASIQLSQLEVYDGMPIDGILGYDFLNRFVVGINYQDQTLTIWEPDSFTYSGPGEKIPITIEGNTPQVAGRIDGDYEGTFRIDTGSRSSLDLHAPFVREHELLKKYPKYLNAPSGFGVGGASRGVIARIKSFQIGSFTIDSPVCGFSLAEEGAFATTKSAGNIGGGILKKFNVIFDYGRNQMILEKNKNFDLPDTYNMSGLLLMKQDKDIKVYDVIKGSPAEKAKLKAGDKILSIDHQPAGSYNLQQIRELLNKKDGTSITLEVQSEEKTREVKLTLKGLI